MLKRVFGKDKLSFYISTALRLEIHDGFDFLRDHTIEVSRDFLGGTPSFWINTLPVLETMGLANVETKRFDLTRDHVIDVSRDIVGEALSF